MKNFQANNLKSAVKILIYYRIYCRVFIITVLNYNALTAVRRKRKERQVHDKAQKQENDKNESTFVVLTAFRTNFLVQIVGIMLEDAVTPFLPIRLL